MVLKRRNGLEYIKNQKDDEKGDSPTPGALPPNWPSGPVPARSSSPLPRVRRYRAGLPPDHLAGIEGKWIRVTPCLPCTHGFTPPRCPLPDPLLLLARSIPVIWTKSDATTTMTDPVHTATALPAG